MKSKILMIVMLLSLVACAADPVVQTPPQSSLRLPPLPPLNAQESLALEKNYLERMQNFLQGKLPQLTSSEKH